jgi:CHAT domain-containing protein
VVGTKIIWEELLSLNGPSHPQELTAAQAVRDLLGSPSLTAESLFDTVERRPVLLSVEAEEILDGFITSTAAQERDDSSQATRRLGLERLRRTLRDCRAHGVDAVRQIVLTPLPDEVQAALVKHNISDVSQLRSDQTMIDWREGRILLALGRIEEGIGYLKRSAAALHERGWHDVAAETEMLLWDAVRGDRVSGDLKASLVHAENAAKAYRKAGDNAGLRHALRILAVDSDVFASGSDRSDYYLALLGEVDTDLATWLRSYVSGSRLMWSDPDAGRTALRWCMDSVYLVGADEEDRAHWRNECARKLAFVDADVAPGAPADTAQDHFVAALLAFQNEQEVAADDHVRRAVSLAEEQRRSVVTEVAQLNLSANLSPIYDLAAVMADRAGHSAEAVDVLELNTSRSLLARLTMHRLWASVGTDAVVASAAFKRQVVRYLTDVERRGSTGERAQLHTSLNRLGEALVAAEQEVLATTSDTRRIVPPVAAARLAEHLGKDDVVVAYSPVGAIYVVTRTGASRIADLDTAALERLCAEYRRHVSVPDHDDSGPELPAAELEAACVDPIRAAVAGYRRVLVVPNESLWGVPLGALGVRPLGANHIVAYVPSLSVLDHLVTRPYRTRRVERFVGIGNPDGGLPYAASELAHAASRYYDRTVQTGAAIDVEAFHADLPSADIVHIACHGIVFDEFPDLTALHITGTGVDREFLWAPDLVRLNLRARLVVLAACHAGLSKALPGNEYVGLPGMFLASGARTVLGPLWRVDDRVTARLMAHFHAALPETGPAGALRQAQEAIKAEPAWAHPYYWAAFQLFGLP